MPVRLSEAAREALQANSSVWEARLQWLVRKVQVQGAWSVFEPALTTGITRSSEDYLTSAKEYVSLFGKPEYAEKRTEYQVAVEGKFFSGADYRLGYSIADTTGDYVSTHEYESNLGIRVDQPLLRGFARYSPLIAIRLARNEELIAFHTYRKQMIAVVANVQTAYWDLALAQELHRIAVESVRMAGEIAADARQRTSLGKMSDLDLAEAETQSAIRQAEAESSLLAVSEAAVQLRLAVGAGRIGSAADITAVELLELEAAGQPAPAGETDTRVQQALRLQPEILIGREELAKSDIQMDYRLDQRLPELNAHGSFGYQGLSDSPSGSLNILQSQNFPTWSIALDLRIPLLGDLKGESQLQEARLTKDLAARKLRAAERDTAVTTSALAQRMVIYGRQAENARSVSGFKKRLLDVELARFDAGKSDIRQVYDVEQALSDARKQELERARLFRRASIDLSAASGATLSEMGLESLEGDRIVLSPALLNASQE